MLYSFFLNQGFVPLGFPGKVFNEATLIINVYSFSFIGFLSQWVFLSKNLKENIYKSIIPRNVKLAEAPSHGLPIVLYDSKCNGAEGYRALADEVIERDVRDWYQY